MASVYVKNVIPYKSPKKTYKTQYINFVKKVGFPFDLKELDKMLSGFGSLSIQDVPENSVESFEKYIVSSLYAIKKDKEHETAFIRLSENEKLFSIAAGQISNIKDSPVIGKYLYVTPYESKIFNTKKDTQIHIGKNSEHQRYACWKVGVAYNGEPEIEKSSPVFTGCGKESKKFNDLYFIAEHSLALSDGVAHIDPYTVIEVDILRRDSGTKEKGLLASVGPKEPLFKNRSIIHRFDEWKDIYFSSFGGVAIDSFRIPVDKISLKWVEDKNGGFMEFFHKMKIIKHESNYALSLGIGDSFLIVSEDVDPIKLQDLSRVAIAIRSHAMSKGHRIENILPLPSNGEKNVSLRNPDRPKGELWIPPIPLAKVPDLVARKKAASTIASVLSSDDIKEEMTRKNKV